MMVYVSNAESHEISVLDLNGQDGRSRLIETVATRGSVMSLAIDPGRKCLYAALRSKPHSLSSWGIHPDTGRLTPMSTVPAADDMAYVSTDRSGRYLFGASYFGDKISVNAIGAQGEISAEPLHVIPTGKHAHCIAIDPSNQFLFVTNLGADVIQQYRFDESRGGITPNRPPAVASNKGAGPRHIAFHPHRPWVFCTNELDGTVSMYLLSTSGTLSLRGSISMMPAGFKDKPWAADLHVTPNGTFLYASERRSSTIAAFRINDGSLSLIGHYPTERQPRGFNIDPQGQFLLALGETSNGLRTHAIDAHTGALQTLSHIHVGQRPIWVEIVPLPA
jgi:6-phosphogluconolactonase